MVRILFSTVAAALIALTTFAYVNREGVQLEELPDSAQLPISIAN